MDDNAEFNTRLMFEAYLYDYLKKKNMHQTAEIYRRETNLDLDSEFRPAIDTPDGFLHEWWSIFYDTSNYQQQGDDHPRNSPLITVEQMTEAMQQTNVSTSNKINSQQTNASLSNKINPQQTNASPSNKINLRQTDASLSNKINPQQTVASPLNEINAQQTNASVSNKISPQQTIASWNEINAQQTNASLLNQISQNENTIDQLARGTSGLAMTQNAMGSMIGPSTEAQRVEFVALPSHQQELLKFSLSNSTSSSTSTGIPAKPIGQEAASSANAAKNLFILPSEISQVAAGYWKHCWDLESAKSGQEIRNQSDSQGPRSSGHGVPFSMSETSRGNPLSIDNNGRSVSSHTKDKKKKNTADDVYKEIP